MKNVNVLGVLILLLPVLALADFTLLDASFDDKTVDAPIGTGGPDLGEPIEVHAGLSATVRDEPFATPALEIVRVSEGSTAPVVFEFVDEASVDVGKVTVSFDVIIVTPDNYELITVYEQGFWSSTFAKIYTDSSGNLRLSDAAGYYGILGLYASQQFYNFRLVFDCVADTYDLFIDDVPIIEGRGHGKSGVGIGRLAFKIVHSAGLDSGFIIDELLVTADEYTAAENSSFSEVKPIY